MTNYNPGDFSPAPQGYQQYPAQNGYQQPDARPLSNPSSAKMPISNQAANSFAKVFEYDSNGQKIQLTKELVQSYLVGDSAKITDAEFMMFAELCRARKLNPFLKEAYLIKYGTQAAQLVVSKDVILKRAVLNPNYNGKRSGIIVKDRATGKLTERAGTFYDPDTEDLKGGWCSVKRKDWDEPEYKSVSLHEVAKKKSDGTLNGNWLTQPATMLEKVAITRCLREAFVEDFAGLYIEDEFDNIQTIPSEAPAGNAIDPMEKPADQPKPQAKTVSINDL